ncbi:hypothetical protein [Erythrobacter litoralis]|uniref:Uncharacterized protein n=1 Tax=Erythrobacter litoralis (strain HTCC2594) TaxID=314225 RepID=Q2NCZ7_ERYLH|nr:hypothetical protein [Erythrobacter litoralis]ABC62444.1 hypothetical protein ELI_01760 [Erythrobacter litoralis HTCC2594]
MIVGGSRLRQIGWAAALGVVFALFVALTFRVNAVKSEVVRAERQIVALKRETMRLETEFETRANQQQLANWNAVDFGYVAPRADQYLENERQLASLSEPVAPGAPAPIRVARSAEPQEYPALVSPLTGRPVGEDADPQPEKAPTARPTLANDARGEDRPSLAERLGMQVDLRSTSPDFTPAAKVSE